MAHGPGSKHADKIIILPYLGYGTPSKLTVCGRVLEDEGFAPAAARDSRLRNFVHFLKRMESDEVPGAAVRACFKNIRRSTSTDREGYFRLEIPARSLKGGVWYPVELESPPLQATATARVLVPAARARFGVISDIDDTVVQTNVTRKVRMIVSLALSSARTRKPFPGVAAFYRALHAGVNPVFYVSKSPWNLYAPLAEYLDLQGFPRGPLLLRDFGLRPSKTHKTDAIEDILKTYPKLPFVLSGDSGEHDPEIYSALVRRYPERIRAIYIRSVHVKRIGEVERLAAEVSTTGCQLVLAPDAETAAAHAAAEGLIQASELRAVRADSASDRSSSKPALSSGGLK